MDEDEFFIGTRRDEEIADEVRVQARGGDDDVFFTSSVGSIPEFIVFGQGGDDTIRGQFGPDYEVGFFSGGGGDDDILAFGGILRGQSGDDALSQFRGSFLGGDPVGFTGVLRGGAGDDVLSVGTAAGDSGVDLMLGDAGDDLFSFGYARGTGRARMTGGDGADTFGNGSVTGRATITDFDFGEGDRLNVPNEEQGFAFDGEGIMQTVGGTDEDPFLLISYSGTDIVTDNRFFVTYKLLGLDAPLPDAAFV